MVLIYVLKGGLTSAIYTEVLQFFMIVLGFAPVVYLGLKDVGGWHAMTHSLQAVAANPGGFAVETGRGKSISRRRGPRLWKPLVLQGPDSNPMGVDLFAMVFGLGFVLSFGYWCTNFLVVQRAMAAKNMTAARNTPLVAAVPKMFFPFLVIVPGMIAIALAVNPGKNYRLPPPPIDSGNFANAIQVLSGSAQNPSAEFSEVSKAIGKRMSQEKVQNIAKSDLVGTYNTCVAQDEQSRADVQTSRTTLKQLRRGGNASASEIEAAKSKVEDASGPGHGRPKSGQDHRNLESAEVARCRAGKMTMTMSSFITGPTILSAGIVWAGAHRVAGVVHVRHGGQRDRF